MSLAFGSHVSASGGVATYQAAPGEANGVFPLVVNGALQVRETNSSVPLSAGQGSRGTKVWLLQRGLHKLGFAVPRTGFYDGGTSRGPR